MTGHGRGTASSAGWRFTVECASVNRKGIEIAVALPKPLATLEPKVREEVQQAVRRGRVNVTVTLEAAPGNEAPMGVIDKNAARRALRELQALRDEFSLPGEISLELLLR
ncbi:MAG: YicC/YloC family endoribonuclease, partial [Chthoniobacterales bacterium]